MDQAMSRQGEARTKTGDEKMPRMAANFSPSRS
jgi:hypothetical protein